MTTRHLRAFGVDLASKLPLPGAWTPRPGSPDALRIVRADPEEIASAWSGEAAPGWEGRFGDGERFVCRRGQDGDHLFRYGEQAVFHLSAGGGLLLCAPRDPADLAWQRVLLDSVLFSVALLRGHEALHAAAVQTPAGVLAITALSGGGKSTACSELLRRGYELVADDVVALSRDDRNIVAHPGAPVMNLPPERLSTVGRHLATFPDDAWIEVPVVANPQPLSRIVVLARSPGAAVACTRSSAPTMRLLAALLRFPATRMRERIRFDLACDIAARIPVHVLSADLRASPARLADELEGLATARVAA